MQSYFLTSTLVSDAACLTFYVAAGLLLYTWLLYPGVLAILPARRTKAGPGTDGVFQHFPSVSVVVAANNEEGVIEAKIRGFLSDPYPGKSELLIVSDGSTDRTVEIASRFVSSRVRLFAQTARRGKGGALAFGVPRARGEILVFTDATSVFGPQTMTELVRPFNDETVGLVTGRVKVEGSSLAGLYRHYEEAIERLEEPGGVISTAHGCIYAMRRSLWCQHDAHLTNDFYHPILVNLRGFDVAVAPKAACTEVYSPNPKTQFQRQVRMVALAAFVYFKCLPVLLFTRKWRSLFILTSHKLMRWLTVPYLILLAVASAWLCRYGRIYMAVLGAESLLFAAVMVGALIRRIGVQSRLSFVTEFITLSWAGTVGLWKAGRGHLPTIWETAGAQFSAAASHN
jgi:cellulose synthase/poly-beta-1,6-N-acetylglucosamine synthase-like glycosyltransferase